MRFPAQLTFPQKFADSLTPMQCKFWAWNRFVELLFRDWTSSVAYAIAPKRDLPLFWFWLQTSVTKKRGTCLVPALPFLSSAASGDAKLQFIQPRGWMMVVTSAPSSAWIWRLHHHFHEISNSK
jgi:hypothetical protein